MSDNIRIGSFRILPPVVKNLLILNALFFLLKIVLWKINIDLDALLGLHYFGATDFHVWQPLTYMFMHNDFGHLFFNMFALWMFGAPIENMWGTKKFLIFYFITGIGAGLAHYLILSFQMLPELSVINTFLDTPTMDNLSAVIQNHTFQISEYSGRIYSDFITFKSSLDHYQQFPNENETLLLNDATVFLSEYRSYFLNLPNIIGASGSVFGLLLAFGMSFPNSRIYLYFLIPIKAKWFVIAYGALELFYGVTGTQDGVGHFAHLGGMLFGFILILIWRKQERNRQNRNQEYYY